MIKVKLTATNNSPWTSRDMKALQSYQNLNKKINKAISATKIAIDRE